tara:strand:+ start:29 stop:349 length:321 start_codon:yes stop_codon:yes gene_type:complete
MQIKVGTKLSTLPKSVPFGRGRETIFVERKWDTMLKDAPYMWVCLEIMPKSTNKKGTRKSNGTFWTRAKHYNKRYADLGFKFSARSIGGVYTFWGRYEPIENQIVD